MRKVQSLRRAADFDAVYKAGRVEGGKFVVVRSRQTAEALPRVGFVCTKAVGGAVVRNRVKRRLRAIVAALDLKAGRDIVISARKSAVNAPFADLQRTLTQQLKRSGVIAGDAVSREQETR
jgi:ribonuclease P protein component